MKRIAIFLFAALATLVACKSSNNNAIDEPTPPSPPQAEVRPSQFASDAALLDYIEKVHFNYMWDGAEPTSGLARERIHLDNNYPQNDRDVVTTGGSGFGIAGLLAACERGFITRQACLQRLTTIVDYLARADRFHGVWPHWLDGPSGKVKPFSQKDNGGDLVESCFLMQGLLCARQYFNGTSDAERALVEKINALWHAMEFDWYTRGGQEVIYWHWSPDYGWEMNFPLEGYNECLIVYVLAAASPTHTISADVYRQGWGTFTFPVAGNQPLFFAHYSFLGLDPRNLSDTSGSYWDQNVAQARYNYNYCVRNPQGHAGYSASSWGLTASDYPGGYTASSPSNDRGTIAPTAALASMPYTPDESMAALRYFYYKIGDSLWGSYGFKDAFCLDNAWFASSYIAIDQGPIIAMIENHRTALLWKLFMKNQDVRGGLTKLGIAYE